MKRSIFILIVTFAGCLAAFVDAFWGLLLYSWYAFASPLELTFGQMEGTRLSFVVGLILVLTTFNQRKRICTKHPLTFLSVLFVCVCFSSLAASGRYSVIYILKEVELLAKLAIISLLAPVLLDSMRNLRLYLVTIGISVGFIAAYYGIFGLFAGSTGIKGPGRLGDNNAYAASLTAVLPIIFYAGRYAPRVVPAFAQMGATSILFGGTTLAVILTFSRGGFLSLVAILVSLLFKLRGLLVRAVGWGIVLPGLVFGGYQFYQLDPLDAPLPTGEEVSTVDRVLSDYLKRLMTMRGDFAEEESAAGRLHFWKVAVEMAERNPLFGVGLGRFRDEYERYDFSEGRFGPYRAVHNLFFSILAETGLLGLGVFLAMLGSAFVAQYRAQRSARLLNDRAAAIELSDYASMARISLLGFLVASCFITTYTQEILWALFSISIALELLGRSLVAAEQSGLLADARTEVHDLQVSQRVNR